MRGEGARNEDTQNERFLGMQSDGFTNRKIIFDCAMKGSKVTTKNCEFSCGEGEGDNGNLLYAMIWLELRM
jgi:hypothetical protein